MASPGLGLVVLACCFVFPWLVVPWLKKRLRITRTRDKVNAALLHSTGTIDFWHGGVRHQLLVAGFRLPPNDDKIAYFQYICGKADVCTAFIDRFSDVTRAAANDLLIDDKHYGDGMLRGCVITNFSYPVASGDMLMFENIRVGYTTRKPTNVFVRPTT